MNYLLIPAGFLLAFYIMWVLYVAVMNIKRVRDLGLLTPMTTALGMPLLIVGYILDFALNKVCMSIILWEIPREMTISARLKRHNSGPEGWRKSVAVWFEPILDPFDPSGDHI